MGAKLMVLLLLAAFVTAGCGGSEGISSGGAITGTVYGNSSGGSISYTPLAGVTVTAIRVDSAAVSRTAVTDGNGHYYFGELPIGEYQLYFYALGWSVTSTGYPGAVGSTVNVYVSAGSTVNIGQVQMVGGGSTGDANVVLTLLDWATGQPISGATVLIGSTTAYGSYGGNYTASVPVAYPGQAMGISVWASGYDSASLSPSSIVPVAYQTVYVTAYLGGSVYGTLQGSLQISDYASFYVNSGILSTVSITSDSVPLYVLNPTINGTTGFFSCTAPSGNSGSYVNLYFSSPYFHDALVTNILVRPGVNTLTSAVNLIPKTVSLVGLVVDSSGGAPSGGFNAVTLVEIGRSASLYAGSYTLTNVPVGIRLQLQASVYNPYLGRNETATAYVTPTYTTGGLFNVPTIRTY